MPLSPLERQNKLRSFIQLANESLTRSEFKAAFENVVRTVKVSQANLTAQIASALRSAESSLTARIDARLAQVKDGARGPQGPKGDKGDTVVGPKGDKGDKGDTVVGPPGKDANVQEAVALTIPQVIEELDRRVPLLGDALRFGLESYINDFLKKNVLGPGGGTSFAILQSGTQKVQQPLALDFKGSGAPTITLGQNGMAHLDFPGGAGLSILTATGTVDNSNTTFTFASTPKIVVVNGAQYRNGHGVKISGTTATLDNPAGTGGDVYGL